MSLSWKKTLGEIIILVREHAGLIASLSGVFIALSLIRETKLDPGVPDFVFVFLFSAGIILFALLILLWPAYEIFYRATTEVSFAFRIAKRDELQEMLPFYGRVVGGEMPSINSLKDLHRANDHCFIFYEKTTKNDGRITREIVGFCTVVPVNRDAADLLSREELNGLRLNKTHVMKSGKKPFSIYVGSIGADGSKCRAEVLSYALGQLQVHASAGVSKVYTRPITKAGLRIAKKYGFHPVNSGVGPNDLGRLYVLDLVDGADVYTRRKRQARKVAVSAANSVSP